MTPDSLAEVWATLRRHKLRTGLTMLSVAWGVFVLIVLLGAGRGLEKGTAGTFNRDALNALWISGGTTSVPFAGLGPGRKIRFDSRDYDSLLELGDRVESLSAMAKVAGPFQIRYGQKHASFDLRGVYPDHQYIEMTHLETGRFLTSLDVQERRKVVVLGKYVATFLFGEAEALGKWVQIGATFFRVIGVVTDQAGPEEERCMYAPISTLQLANGGSREIADMGLTLAGNFEQGQETVERVRTILAANHDFSPADKRALTLFNVLEFNHKVGQTFLWIRILIWVVGIGTLLAGIVGVSNIMLISVRERTQEIGVRKALGATPGSIVRLVVQEALLVTLAAGYLGLVGGLALVDFAKRFVPPKGFMGVPEVDVRVAAAATLLIIIAGVLAGFFPARLAAKVNPIVALRSE